MAESIDPDDLIDTSEAAAIVGVSPGSLSVYRKRTGYSFPAAVVEKGRCVLWRRQDVEAWAEARRTT